MVCVWSVSTKTQLLEQIEELTTVKNEMTTEVSAHIYYIHKPLIPNSQTNVWCVQVERLHSQLEQERSKNKLLQAELAKLASKTGKTRHN